MRRLLILACILCSGVTFSRAQKQPAKSRPTDRWEVFAGYTFSRQYGMVNPDALAGKGNYLNDNLAPFNQNGGQVAISYFPTAHFGATYQMSFLYSGDRTNRSFGATAAVNAQRYMIGPAFRYRLKGGTSRTTLFAHQLFGASHDTVNFSVSPPNGQSLSSTESSGDLTIASGGGVDFRFSRHFSLRPAQVDYWMKQATTSNFSFSSPSNLKQGIDGFDYSTGAVMNF